MSRQMAIVVQQRKSPVRTDPAPGFYG